MTTYLLTSRRNVRVLTLSLWRVHIVVVSTHTHTHTHTHTRATQVRMYPMQGGQPPQCELNRFSSHYTLAEGRNASYYLRETARDDAPVTQAVPWLLSPPRGNVTLLAGAMHSSTTTAITYVMSQYSVDDVLYWFRIRAGVKSPPGKNHGWDGGAGAPDYP